MNFLPSTAIQKFKYVMLNRFLLQNIWMHIKQDLGKNRNEKENQETHNPIISV